eukprot:CAMPEP_0117473384 /NCGR_PEP_ID=MMETSP0784-20121206/8745_1 /TAXON_ID=39447 /ORGANISM="" /LENGTH=150 /DNA_ID=CAMNT_0005267585 /DNA_START=127 /DNA_END=580 /DNA_ORIENTATION=-
MYLNRPEWVSGEPEHTSRPGRVRRWIGLRAPSKRSIAARIVVEVSAHKLRGLFGDLDTPQHGRNDWQLKCWDDDAHVGNGAKVGLPTSCQISPSIKNTIDLTTIILPPGAPGPLGGLGKGLTPPQKQPPWSHTKVIIRPSAPSSVMTNAT